MSLIQEVCLIYDAHQSFLNIFRHELQSCLDQQCTGKRSLDKTVIEQLSFLLILKLVVFERWAALRSEQ